MKRPARSASSSTYSATAPATLSKSSCSAINPGPFTFHGTGTYVVGRGSVAVVDPDRVGGNLADAVLRHGIEEDRVAFLQKPYTPDALARFRQVLLDFLPGFAQGPAQ